MADSQLDVTIRARDELSPQLKSIESNLIRWVGAVSSAISTLKIASFPIQQAADLQRELANVTKTTNFTGQQIRSLTDQLALLSLTTDTSATDLAKIAAAAGQQGLGREGVEGIVKFTDAVARMASVLDLSAQDSATAIGKILNIFQIPLREIEKVSSAINQVSNNSTAKATELLNVLKRLGDAGGSLKFTQSLALSATAIDLGATPEVAGTTLSKFINATKVRAKNFVDLLKAVDDPKAPKYKDLNVDKFAEKVQDDAFDVFREVMDAFGKLKPADKQAAINKLFGGGRITSLADKFLQDMFKNSSVLDKNLNQANGGFDSGQSSIREQATVMATLVKQVDILKNSFRELGRQAGESLLGPLAGYVAQLRVALQTEQFRSFARAVVAALGDAIGAVVSFTKFMAGLNINWENFIKVLKLFLEIKVAKVLLSMFAGVPGISQLIGLVSNATKQSGAAAAQAGEQGAQGAKKQVTAYQALREQLALLVRDYRTAATAAEAQTTAAARKASADAAQLAYRNSLKAQQPNLNRSQVAIKQAQDSLQQAQLSAALVSFQGETDTNVARASIPAAIAQAEAANRTREINALNAHKRAIAAIEARYAGASTAGRIAQRDAELAAETANYAKIEAALKVAGAKRIAQAEANAKAQLAITETRIKAEIAAEETKVAAQQKVLKQMEIQAKIAASNAAQMARIAANSAAGVVPATPNPNGTAVVPIVAAGAGAAAGGAAGAASANAAATAGSRLAGVGAAIAGLFTSIPRLLGLIATGFRFVLTWLGPVYLGFMLLSSVLDALGVTDKIPGFLRSIGEALGFVSEKQRQKKAEDDAAHERMIREQKDLEDLLDRYGKLKDAKGQVSEANLDKVRDQFKGATSSNDVDAGAKDLLFLLQGSNAEKKKTEDALARGAAGGSKQAQIDVTKAAADLDKAKKALESFKETASKPTLFDDESTAASASLMTTRLENEFAKQQKIYDDAVGRAKAYGVNTAGELQKALPALQQQVTAINSILAGIFTPQTQKIFDDAATKLIPLKKELEDLKAAANADGTAPDPKNPNSAKLKLAEAERDRQTDPVLQKKAADRVKAIQDEIAAKEAIINNFIRQLDENINKLGENSNKTLGGILKASGQYVLSFLNGTSDQIKTLQTASQQLPPSVVTDAPALVNPNINVKNRGTKSYQVTSGNSGESEARKLARAQAELQKAQLVARFELEKQYNDQFLAEEQRLYDQGLLDLKSYYAGKTAIDQINLQNEIVLKQKEIDNKLNERSNPAFKQSDRVRIDAEIAALNGQKKVLESKLGEIPKAAEEAVRKAVKEFNESTLTDKLDIMRALGLSSFEEELQTSLDLVASQTKEKLERFKTELKAGTPGITQAFIDAFQLNGLVKAIDPVLQSIADKASITVTSIEQRISKIQFQQSTGKLTDIEAERATNTQRSLEAEAVRTQITETENLREKLIEKTRAQAEAKGQDAEAAVTALKSSDAYRKQTNDIDALKQKYVELKTVIDETATSINKGIGDSLANALKSFADGTGGGLKAILLKFGKDINDTILNSVTKNVSQQIMKSLDSTGTGGIGGWFSSLFNGTAMDPTAIDQDMLGRTEATAMYVRDINGDPTKAGSTGNKVADSVAKLFGKDDLKSITKNIGKDGSDGNGDISLGGGSVDPVDENGNVLEASKGMFDKVKSFFSDGFDSLTSTIGDFGSSFLDGITSFGSSIGDSISGLFSGLGDMLGSLGSGLSDILGSIFGSGGGGGGAGIMEMFASFFHTGGVVGSGVPMSGYVSPLVFANAVRYHTGGIAGLQPDEVPSILKKGEEVLTANDPRHRNNGGADDSASRTIHAPVSIVVNTPDANSFRKSQDQIASQAGMALSRAIYRNT